jgi:CRP/FNR family transcriptional regulator, cyclic AMP receptor protein
MTLASKKLAIAGRNTTSAVSETPLPPYLTGQTTLANIAADQSIFAQGADTNAAYYTHTGLVKIVVVSKSGQEAVVRVLPPRSLFGVGGVFNNARRVASAIAVTDCVVERIPASAMRRALDTDPKFTKLLMAGLLKRARELQENLIDQHFHSAEKRLARTLLRLSNIEGNDEADGSLPRISQTMLAEMVGSTRARINFLMNKFRRLGLIDYNGKITVHRSLARILEQG